MHDPQSHLSAERLAEYSAGKMEAREAALIEAHLRNCVTCAELASRTAVNGGAPPPASLDRTADYANPSQDAQQSAAGEAAETQAPHERFRILRPHARGGLGQVSVALDEQFGREVALKEIQAPLAGDPQTLERFLREATLTARLEHPGIVPVYSLATGAAGAPSYAMRFIRGESLAQAIGRSQRIAAADARRFELRKLLARLVGVCQAVAYAHTQGVIHRDIKPSNIMLGEFGETLLVDWGLARNVGECDAPPSATTESPPAATPRAQQAEQVTLPGAVLGTPAYMSPEQASGQAVGTASDIYSLGATLYQVLTGQPPVVGRDTTALLEAVRTQAFPAPRSVQPSTPHALEAICLKAMHREPDQRYATAAGLADDLERFLADEPVQAWLEPLYVRGRRWVRRHQALAVGTTATLVLGLAASVVVAVLSAAHAQALGKANQTIGQQNSSLTAANADLSVARRDADAKRQAAETAQQAAERERDRAEALNDFLIRCFQRPDPAVNGRAVTVFQVLGIASGDLHRRSDIEPQLRADYFEIIGRTYQTLGLVGESLAAFDACRALRAADAESDEESLRTVDYLRAMSLIDAGRYDEAAALAEEVERAERAALGPDDFSRLLTLRLLAIAQLHRHKTEEGLHLLEEVVERLGRTLGAEHEETTSATSVLALAYIDAGQVDRALPMLAAARNAILDLDDATDAQRGEAHAHLARAYTAQGDLARSAELYAEALRCYEVHYGESHTLTLNIVHSLGVCRQEQRLYDDARDLLQRASTGRRRQLGEDHRDVLESEYALASLDLADGRTEDGLERLLKKYDTVVAACGSHDPFTLRWLESLARATADSGAPNVAAALWEQLLAAQTQAEPLGGEASLQTLNRLLDSLENAGQQATARERAIEAIGRIQAQGLRTRGTLRLIHRLAEMHEMLGESRDAMLRYEQAARELGELLGPFDPDTIESQHRMCALFVGSDMLAEAERALPACAAAREAHDRRPGLPGDTRCLLAELRSKQGRHAEALQLWHWGYEQVLADFPRMSARQRVRLEEAALYRGIRICKAAGAERDVEYLRGRLAALRTPPLAPPLPPLGAGDERPPAVAPPAE